jgi:curved DNA-binding protein CbpA
MRDFYYILGLPANCTSDEIREAYRKLSKKFHPDLNAGDAYFESRFREVQEAYEILSDPVKRGKYDAALNEVRSHTTGEDSRRREYREYRAPKAKSNGPGAGMIIILFSIALIFGFYLIKSFSNSKPVKVYQDPAFNKAFLKTHKHHKKKPAAKSKSDDDTVIQSSTISAAPVKLPAPAKPTAIAKPNPVSNVATDNSGGFLYSTTVRPNFTGVVNMRKSNAYNSEIIKTIPANSKVFVMEKGATYYKVSFDNYVGYVPKWALQTK